LPKTNTGVSCLVCHLYGRASSDIRSSNGHGLGPLLEEIQEHLLPLILALYLYWLDGPSLAAQELRAQEETRDPFDEEQAATIEQEKAMFQQELATLEELIGSTRLQTMLHSEHLIPAMFRLLDEVSWAL
jgi:hypothetical protein